MKMQLNERIKIIIKKIWLDLIAGNADSYFLCALIKFLLHHAEIPQRQHSEY